MMNTTATTTSSSTAPDACAADMRDIIALAVEGLTDAVVVTGAGGQVRYLNPAAEGLLGFGMERLSGRSLWDVARIEDGITSRPIDDPLTHYTRQRASSLTPDRLVLGSEGFRSVQISATSIRNAKEEPIGAAFVMRDAANLLEILSRTAHNDTHHPSRHPVHRRELERRLATAVRHVKGSDQHALLFLHFAGLDVVEDVGGDEAGQQALQQVAALCLSGVRARDAVAQWNENEFAVMLERCPRSRALQTARLLRTLLQNFRFVWRNRAFELGVSIGVASASHANSGSPLSEVQRACEMATAKDGNQIICADDYDDPSSAACASS